MCGPHFSFHEDHAGCEEYGAQKEIDEQTALGVGMKEKAEELVAGRFIVKRNEYRLRLRSL
jgi:hypothetical protein